MGPIRKAQKRLVQTVYSHLASLVLIGDAKQAKTGGGRPREGGGERGEFETGLTGPAAIALNNPSYLV